MDSDIQQGPSTTPATTAVAPQIRSRITVVCAECKRLKLKCDRRNPCGSCQKRDTVSRCIYSPAAAEKVDLHSLNNRLIQVEATLAQLTSGQFMPSYPFSAPSSSNGPPPPSLSLNVNLSPPTIQHSSLAIPLEEIGGTWLNEFDLGFNLPAEFTSSSKDGTLPNVKVEPHSVDISNSLSGEFDDFDMVDRPSTSSSSSSVNQAATTTTASPNLAALSISPSHGHIQLPPTSVYYSTSPPSSSMSNKPQLTSALIALLPSLNTHASGRQLPQQLSLLSYLTLAEESSAYTYPFLNWKTLRERALELVVNARPNAASSAANTRDKEMARERETEKEREKKEREVAQARQLFMGSRTRPVFGNSASGPSIGDVTMEDMDITPQSSRSRYRPEMYEDHSGRLSTSTKIIEGIPFFAVLCAALAIGANEGERRAPTMTGPDENKKGTVRPRSKSKTSLESIYWYSLSVQAIGIWEASVAVPSVPNTPSTQVDPRDINNDLRQGKEDQQHEMDYITACLLQLAFLSKEGSNSSEPILGTDKVSDKNKDNLRKRSPGLSKDSSKSQSAKGVAAVMFPLVGKIVNYARQMSLNRDPEDIVNSAQGSESGFSTSPSASTSTISSNASGLPSGAKKARSNSKLSDPSVSTTLSASRAVKESRFTLYEAEMRRRVWWTIMYYDLFISDIMNQPPLIADNSFNTKRPVANVDDKAFGPTSIRIPPPADGGEDGSGYSKNGMGYFEIRSRLTLLVRNIKRRMNTPEFGHAQQVRTSYYGASPNGHCYSIDQAASMESEVRAWLNDLPSYYQIDGENTQRHVETGPELTLIAQRCEVSMTAHRLVLRVYLPFLKKHASGVPHQASLGSINAAHGIMKAAKSLSELWKSQGSLISSSLSPALFDFYPFPRCVFDAAIVCAHAVIKQPSTMWAAAAMEDVDVALEIFKSTSLSKFGSAVGATYVVSSSDCIRIIEALKLNAEAGEGSHRGGSPNVPSKRKHHEVDELRSSSPPSAPAYVYPTVSTNIISAPAQEIAATSGGSHSIPPLPAPIVEPSKRQLPFPVVTGVDRARTESSATTSPKGNDKEKKAKRAYPVVGVRKRPPKDSPPFVQSPAVPSPSTVSNSNAPTPAPGSRQQSVSTPVIEKSGTASVRTMYSNSHQQSTATAQPPPFQSPNIPQLQAAVTQEQFAYRSRSSSLSQDPRLHVQRPRRDSTLSTSTDYPMGTHNAPEDSSASPKNAATPEMHLGPSMSSRQHALQQPYVESPLERTAQFEFPFNHPQAPVEAFDTRNNAFDTRPDDFSPSSSSYNVPGPSNTAISASNSPYTTTNGTPAFISQAHQPPSFSQKGSTHNSTQPQGYYDTTSMYETYSNAPSAAQAGILHRDMVQSVMDDRMIFDQVSYDVKPSMEELNEQHRQQHTYQAYDSDPRSQSQLHNAVPSTQMWTTLPQQGHIPDGAATSYWGDPNIPPDNRAFYQT